MAELLSSLVGAGARTAAALVDLVLPTSCGGCGAEGAGRVCAACHLVLGEPAVPTRPSPAPVGLPPCLAGGEYRQERRELILAYKERGRRDLTRPLGEALGRVIRAGWPAPASRSGPLLLVPVPATAAAIRARHGDHMLRLTRAAARGLRNDGRAVGVVAALRALPKGDSAHLGREARAAAARAAFALRSGRGADALRWAADAGAVVLCDDVLTTGATLSAVALRLLEAGVPATFAATLAATRLRHSAGAGPIDRGRFSQW